MSALRKADHAYKCKSQKDKLDEILLRKKRQDGEQKVKTDNWEKTAVEKDKRTTEFKQQMEKSRQFQSMHRMSRQSLHKSSYNHSSLEDYSEDEVDFNDTVIREKLEEYDCKKLKAEQIKQEQLLKTKEYIHEKFNSRVQERLTDFHDQQQQNVHRTFGKYVDRA